MDVHGREGTLGSDIKARMKGGMQRRWIDVQKKTFQAWVNHTLSTRAMGIRDLSTDFADGVVLINLLEILTGKSVGRYSLKPSSRFLKIENVVIALKFIDQKLHLKLYGTSAEDIVDGNTKSILGMVWRLIQTFRIGVSDGEDGLDDTAEEGGSGGSTISWRSQAHSPGPTHAGTQGQSALKRRMLGWCQRQLDRYPNVAVDNFDTSFANGVAFCALLHSMNPELIDVGALDKENAEGNLSVAFRLAEDHLGIPKLLDPRDMIDGKPDELSVMTYISELLYAFRESERVRSRKADVQGALEEDRPEKEKEREAEDKRGTHVAVHAETTEAEQTPDAIAGRDAVRKEEDGQRHEKTPPGSLRASPRGKKATPSPNRSDSPQTTPERSPRDQRSRDSTPERSSPSPTKASVDERTQRRDREAPPGWDSPCDAESIKQRLGEQQIQCAALRNKLHKKRKEIKEYRRREQEWRNKYEALIKENHQLRDAARPPKKEQPKAGEGAKAQGMAGHQGPEKGSQPQPPGEALRLEHVTDLRMSAPPLPYPLFRFLSEEIRLAQVLMEQLDQADAFAALDHECDNHWREHNKRSTEPVTGTKPGYNLEEWDERLLVKTQRQVRAWLARRVVARQRLLRRCQEEEGKMAVLQAHVRGWLARKRYRDLLYMLAQRTEAAKELMRSERKYVDSLRVIIEVFMNPLRKAGSPLSSSQVRSIFSEVEVIMNYTAILLDRVEKKVSAWSHDQCLGDIFLKMTDFLKVYTQYIYNFPKALTTLNACKLKGPFKAFLQEGQNNPRCGDLDFITYLNMPVLRIHYYVAIFEDLLEYTPEDHPDSENIKLAVAKVRDVVKYVEEKRKWAENMQQVLHVQDSLVGKSVEIENLAQPSRRYIREGPLTVIRGTNQKKEGYCFLFNDLLVVARKQKVKVPKGKGRTYKFVIAVPISSRTVIKICPETVYTTPNSFQLINTTKQYTFACASAKERQIWYNDVAEAIKMMVMQQKTIAEKLAEAGNKPPPGGSVDMK